MKEPSKEVQRLPHTMNMNGILKVLQRLPGSKFILEQVDGEHMCLTITHGRYQEEMMLTRYEHIETNADLLIDRIIERQNPKPAFIDPSKLGIPFKQPPGKEDNIKELFEALKQLPGSTFNLRQTSDDDMVLTVYHGSSAMARVVNKHDIISRKAELLIEQIIEMERTRLTEDLFQDEVEHVRLPDGYSLETEYKDNFIRIKLLSDGAPIWEYVIPIRIETPPPLPPETYEPGAHFQDKNGDICQIINVEFGKCQLIDVGVGSPIGNVIDVHDLDEITMDEVDRMYFENTDCLVPVEITHHIAGEE